MDPNKKSLRRTEKSAASLLPPTNVVVRSLFTGTRVVKWKHERKYLELFIVEARLEDSLEWKQLAVVNDRKYNDLDHHGVGVAYRVRTMAGSEMSAPSGQIVVPGPIYRSSVRQRASLYLESEFAIG